MNLHKIVSGAVAAINPTVTGQYKQSNGSTTFPDGKRTPVYLSAVPVKIQKQALTYKDLQQMSGINLNGEACAMYVNGNIEGVDRPNNRGGDIITLPDDSIWLVVHVLENWSSTSGWTKFAVVRQTS